MCRARCCRRCVLPAKCTARASADLLGGADQDRRHRRRPAGRPLRPNLLLARAGQEHLRHRLLHAHERRQRSRRIEAQLLTTVAWKLGGKTEYALEGSVFIGGAVVQWLRDGLGIVKSAADIEKLAATVPDPGGVYMVPAFAGLGAPHWDQYARGTITGITRGTTAAHFARAALESIAFQVADILDIMQKDSGVQIKELRVDGGASANDLLMQFQADLLRVPVVRPKVTETTALGAAYLAGLAVGYWKDQQDVRANWEVQRSFDPQMSEDEVKHRRARWTEALRRSRDWEEHSTIDARNLL